jgi:DNA-directed RNA polymerase alpha subunit
MNENHIGQDLELSIRASNLAKRVGARTVRDLAQLTAEELLSTNCFGETSLREISLKLAERGLRLGMTPPELAGQPGARGNLVVQGKPGTSQPRHDPEHESACCGHCEEAARALRERVAARAVNGESIHVDHAMARKLAMSLAELELSLRAVHCLESEGITTVRDLVIRSDEELLEVRGFGEAMLKEVKAKLAAQGLLLGMKLPPLLGPAPDPKRRGAGGANLFYNA